MKITMSPRTRKGPMTRSTCIEGGTLPAEDADVRRGLPGGRAGLAGLGRRAAGALPAAVGGEHVAQARQLFVVCRALLIVDHEQALGPLAAVLGDLADRLSHLALGGLAITAGPLGLVGENTCRAAACARLRRRRRPPPADSDEQPAVRTAQRFLRPVLPNPPLDQQVAMRAVTVLS